MKNVLRWMSGKGSRSVLHPPIWTPVRAGPLAGCEFFLPQGLKGWAGRIARGEYEPDLCKEITALAMQGGTLYDIGAHIGFFSCSWLKLGGACVECFEPAPGNAEVVRATLVRNALPLSACLAGDGQAERSASKVRVTPPDTYTAPPVRAAHIEPRAQGAQAKAVRVHELALGDRDGDGTLMVNAGNLGKSSMAYLRETGGIDTEREGKVYAQAEEVKVAVRKLDTYAREHQLVPPSAMKIDVEGAEAAVLAGAQELLAAYKPVLLMEIHTIDAALDCAAHLTRLGYRSRTLTHTAGMPVVRWD